MKVILVGGAGFIGLAAIEALSREAQIHVVDTARRLKRARLEASAITITATEDICGGLESVIAGADVLIHLAWSSLPAASMKNVIDDAQNNIVGSLSTFTAAANAGIKKIIFASSGGTVYGNTCILPIEETQATNPVSAYGVSKLAVERYLQLIAFHHGVSGVSLRIGNPYGPYQLAGTPIGLVANFIRQLRAGAPLRIYGDGEVVRDYIWIDDLASAIALAAEVNMESGEYNLGSGEGHSINEVADLVERACGIRTHREHVPQRSFDASKVVLSSVKFTAATNWRPTIPLREGISRMLRD